MKRVLGIIAIGLAPFAAEAQSTPTPFALAAVQPQQQRDCAAAILSVVTGGVTVRETSGATPPVSSGMRLCGGDVVSVSGAIPGAEASIWFPDAEKTLRLGPDTDIVIPVADRVDSVSLLQGALYVISRVKRSFSVDMGIVTAGIDGTEALTHRDPASGALTFVREGVVMVRDAEGDGVDLAQGQAAYADGSGAPALVDRRDADRLPSVFREYLLSPTGAVDWTAYYPPQLLARGADAATQEAATLIARRRFAEAALALDCATAPGNVGARGALCAMLAAITGRFDGPGGISAFAATAATEAPAPYLLALSYVNQARGALAAALRNAQTAAAQTPQDAFAAARVAELALTVGDVTVAQEALAPLGVESDGCGGPAYAQAVAGLTMLASYRFDDASSLFACAIEADPAAPLPWLGQGLTRVRRGDLARGIEDLEVALAMDPRRASTRVWLGRALLDEGREERAATQFAVAAEDDPDNPLAPLFSAFERFAANDPIGALSQIEAAEAAGAGRATVRAPAGLSEDSAVRGAARGRLYTTLGFDDLALREGDAAVATDPASPAASRFLSEALRGRVGDARAQSSALLRANLLSPPSAAPIQPRLLVSDLGLLDTTGPARVTFAEFAPLYDRNGVSAYVSGGVGTQSSWFDEVSATLLTDRVSLGVGQFHTETEGYRDNNDLRHDILAAQSTIAASRSLSLFGQYIYRDTEAGDRRLRFALDEDFDPTLEAEIRRHTGRLGLAYTPHPDATVLGLAHYSDTTVEADQFDLLTIPIPFPPFSLSFRQDLATMLDEQSLNLQAQVIRKGLSLTSPRDLTIVAGGGGGRLRGDFTLDARVNGFGGALTRDRDADEYTGYVYATHQPVEDVTVTAGLAYAAIDADGVGAFNRHALLPKFGATLDIGANVTVRGAYTRSMIMSDADGERIEPDAVAGFRQIEEGLLGAVTDQLGVGADMRLGDGWFIGAEVSVRDQTVPDDTLGRIDVDATSIGGYINKHIGRRWAVAAALRSDRVRSDIDNDIRRLRTVSAPVTATYFHPSGLFARGAVTFVDQEIQDSNAGNTARRDDQFAVVDATLGWRIPGSRATMSLEVQNLFDTDIGFETRPLLGLNGIVDDIAPPTLARERTIMLRGVIAF